ncbi:MAG: S8 family serine peptidase [Kiritimatiellae bacterium]|nr:S8 family serine peptidase [Kiritimatiellia bacterium]MDW8459183.1 S8 family serine peptidase [Verrucomicrobiota bacterium]
MSRVVSAWLLVIWLHATPIPAMADPGPIGGAQGGTVEPVAEAHPEIFLVGWRDSWRKEARIAAHRRVGAQFIREFKRSKVDVVRIRREADRERAIKAYRSRREVRFVEPNYRLRKLVVPNDPMFSDLWGLRNIGQGGGVPGADINVTNVWALYGTGNTNVIVAVIDTGIDVTHPDLVANLWQNPGEIPGNAVDDDGNGIVDDVFGARWTNGDGSPTSGNPMDGDGHGTHVGGTIGAVGNNNLGVAGVNWAVRLMALKFLDDSGSGWTADAIAAIEYAISKGAHILNNSWGGGRFSQALEEAIEAAGDADQLFIAAAGNSNNDNDSVPMYPASYDAWNIIAVASSDRRDRMSSFSSYGRSSVDLAAPGSAIRSTVPGAGYDDYSGTSMATPHVAGAAALLKSIFPNATAEQLKQMILDGARRLPVWEGKTVTGGRLDVGESVRIGLLPPVVQPVSSFFASSADFSNYVDLVWSSPTSALFSHVVVRSNTNGYPGNWSEGALVYTGVAEAVRDEPLEVGQRRFYSIWAVYSTGSTTFYSAARHASVTVGGDPTDYFTEIFSANDNDLSYKTLTLIPDGSLNRYSAFSDPATNFFVDPSGGVPLSLGDDSFVAVAITGGPSVKLYGVAYTNLFVGSNGYISFGTGDTRYVERLSTHFDRPRISLLFDDLNPASGGIVSRKQLADRFVLTYQNVPEYGASSPNSFQAELFFDGRIRITWLALAARDGLAGISAGNGLPANFAESDLTSYPPFDELRVSPASAYEPAGIAGGPFAPAEFVYVLSNSMALTISWSSGLSVNWLEISPRSGVLASGETVSVTVSVSAVAQTLAPGLYEGWIYFTNQTSGRIHARSVRLSAARPDYTALYFADRHRRPDPVLPALRSVGYLVRVATNWPAFVSSLQTGEYFIAAAVSQNGPPSPAAFSAMSNYLSNGGRALLIDRSKNPMWAELFGAAPVGSDNRNPVIITEPDLSAGISNPMTLFNPGQPRFSWGLSPQTGSESIAEYRDGRSALVWGNQRRTAILGFTADALPTNQAIRFFENLIRLIESGEVALSVEPPTRWEISGFEGGPFSPDERLFTVRNHSSNPIPWSVAASASWLSLAPSNGVVAPHDAQIITARVASLADELPPGEQHQMLVFSNTVSGGVIKRQVRILVQQLPGEIIVWDSISPTNDTAMPFGDLTVGNSRSEQIRIANISADRPLEIFGIGLFSADASEAGGLTVDSVPKFRQTDRPREPYHPHILIVGFKDGIQAAQRDAIHRRIGAERLRRFRRIAADVVELNKQADIHAVRKQYLADPAVAYADLNYLVSTLIIPNDPLFGQLWGLRNVGQTGGMPGADIRAPAAWSLVRGGSNVIVAVIDTGIDYSHPDLVENMWRNPGEIPDNGVDDDANGVIDDVYGARWTSGTGVPVSGDPMDDNAHGTHVAGTIGARGDNGIGVVGVNWRARMMALKFLNQSGAGYTADAVAALEYAIDMGARISNNSWGGGGWSHALKNMIDAASAAGHLFVAAAGNSNSDNDVAPSYPASYPCSNILAVASSDHNDQRSAFSSYGRTTVHLAAPGSTILSTVPGGGYTNFSGTSMATPHVAGAAALIWSLNPLLSDQAVKEAIISGVDVLPEWTNRVLSGGRLNLERALRRISPHFHIEGAEILPAIVPPGGELPLTVHYAPRTPGSHTGRVWILSNDRFSPTTTVWLAGSGLPDALNISPPGGALMRGPEGGPFSPPSIIYRLSNQGTSPISWSASASANWMSVSPSEGLLEPLQTSSVQITIAPSAFSLLPGSYGGSVEFVNQSSGVTNIREVLLLVEPQLCDAVDACEMVWSSGGAVRWIAQTNVSADGVDAAESGAIGDDEASWIETTVEGPGILSFDWKVSSEEGYDFLNFEVNGITRASISGENDWETRHVELSNGVHELRWTYVKDFSIAWGEDRGWLDRVVFRRYIFAPASDHAGNYGAAPSNFTHGANQGRGFGPWVIDSSGNATADLFNSSAASANINSENGAAFRFFGGAGGAFVNAIRTFGSPLRSGDTFSVTIAYNWNGGARGLSLLANNDEELFNVNFGPGDLLTFRWTNGSPIHLSTYWSPTTILRIAATQLGSNQLTVSLARNDGFQTNLLSSSLLYPAAKVRFYNGGHPGDNIRYALFANYLGIARSNAHDADQDGLPDWWESEYFGNPTNASPDALAAEGSYTLLEAWVADLNPLDPAASFPRAGITLGPDSSPRVWIEPTSVQRLYGVDSTTNLATPIWIPHLPMATGTGGSVTIPVTHEEPARVYRATIRLP